MRQAGNAGVPVIREYPRFRVPSMPPFLSDSVPRKGDNTARGAAPRNPRVAETPHRRNAGTWTFQTLLHSGIAGMSHDLRVGSDASGQLAADGMVGRRAVVLPSCHEERSAAGEREISARSRCQRGRAGAPSPRNPELQVTLHRRNAGTSTFRVLPRSGIAGEPDVPRVGSSPSGQLPADVMSGRRAVVLPSSA